MYSIKAISTQTGVQPETIRTWERRYDLLSPARDASGRRLYSDEDAAKLRLIASLVKAGHPIRRLAGLETEALKQLGARPVRAARRPEEQQLVDDLLEAVRKADLPRFRVFIGYALSLHRPVAAVEHVLVPTFRAIGTMWQEGEITVGLEHALTAIMKQEMFSVIRTWQMAAKGPTLVLAGLGGELHEIGLLLACYLAVTEGFDCQYWGPNLPPEFLIETIDIVDAKAVVISLVLCTEPKQCLRDLEVVADGLPKSVDLCIGTRPDIIGMLGPLPERAVLFESFEPFHDYLMTLKRQQN